MYKVFNTGFQYDFMRMERKDFYTVYFVKDEVKIPQERFYTLKEAQERCDELNKLELSKITAQEMFEKLGYSLEIYHYLGKSYLLKYSKGIISIAFDLEEKEYSVSEYTYKDNEWYSIASELHQAITQQMKELGWIE